MVRVGFPKFANNDWTKFSGASVFPGLEFKLDLQNICSRSKILYVQFQPNCPAINHEKIHNNSGEKLVLHNATYRSDQAQPSLQSL